MCRCLEYYTLVSDQERKIERVDQISYFDKVFPCVNFHSKKWKPKIPNKRIESDQRALVVHCLRCILKFLFFWSLIWSCWLALWYKIYIQIWSFDSQRLNINSVWFDFNLSKLIRLEWFKDIWSVLKKVFSFIWHSMYCVYIFWEPQIFSALYTQVMPVIYFKEYTQQNQPLGCSSEYFYILYSIF